jgi:oxygen-independent coproporphyrinogen-3 oxidase
MLGVYVHFPFCRVHCSYCAFAVSTNDALQERYFDALSREIALRAGGEDVDTLYFGGGTPSRTSPQHVTRITKELRDRFRIAPDVEFSIEANPEDVTSDALSFWQSLGINRVSIGVQSFHDGELRPLGRVHGGDLARDAVQQAAASGIRTSLDLILGLPQQTAESFRETLDVAVALGVGHISIYMLDMEEGSVLTRQVTRGAVSLPDDDLVANLYLEAVERLAAAGFAQYEISNFARAGEQSRHNLHYWRREEYFAFGLGAHSFLDGRRFANVRDIESYIATPGAHEMDETLGVNEEKRERIFLRLRQPAGLDYEEVVRLCGPEGVEWIEQGVSAGWLRREGERVAFTPQGFLLSTDLISQLF